MSDLIFLVFVSIIMTFILMIMACSLLQETPKLPACCHANAETQARRYWDGNAKLWFKHKQAEIVRSYPQTVKLGTVNGIEVNERFAQAIQRVLNHKMKGTVVSIEQGKFVIKSLSHVLNPSAPPPKYEA